MRRNLVDSSRSVAEARADKHVTHQECLVIVAKRQKEDGNNVT